MNEIQNLKNEINTYHPTTAKTLLQSSVNRRIMGVHVKVEYCGTCGYASKYQELCAAISEKFTDVTIEGYEGRRATFEVEVNGVLVHSKLTTLAWPYYEDIVKVIEEVEQGKDVRQVKAQPIFNCTVL